VPGGREHLDHRWKISVGGAEIVDIGKMIAEDHRFMIEEVKGDAVSATIGGEVDQERAEVTEEHQGDAVEVEADPLKTVDQRN